MDGTWGTYGRGASSWEEVAGSPDYEQRWHVRDPYERWSMTLPGDIAGRPPETAGYHGLSDARGPLAPARFLGADGLRDPDHLQGLSHRMWTAVGRLFGCLHVDGHPDAPRMVVHTRCGERHLSFATPADVRKYGRLVQVAAAEVLDEGWVDPEAPTLDGLLPFDHQVPELARRIAEETPDEVFYDRGYVAHRGVVADWEREHEQRAYLRRLVIHLDHDDDTVAAVGGVGGGSAGAGEHGTGTDPDDPTRHVSAADVAAAAIVQGRLELLAPGGGLAHNFFSPAGQTELDGWKAATESDDDAITVRAASVFGRFDPVWLLAWPLATRLDKLPAVATMIRRAWRALAATDNGHGDPVTEWPAVVKTIYHDAATYHSWQLPTTDEARKFLALVREAAHHVHLTALRTYRTTRAWPGLDYPRLYELLRELHDIETWSDDDVAAAVREADPVDGAGGPGPIRADGTPLYPTTEHQPPA